MFALRVTLTTHKRYTNVTQNVTPLSPVRDAKIRLCNVVTPILARIILKTQIMHNKGKTVVQKYYVCFGSKNVTSHYLGLSRWEKACNAAALHRVTTFKEKGPLPAVYQFLETLQTVLRPQLQTLQVFRRCYA